MTYVRVLRGAHDRDRTIAVSPKGGGFCRATGEIDGITYDISGTPEEVAAAYAAMKAGLQRQKEERLDTPKAGETVTA